MGALLATAEKIIRIIRRGQVYELVYTAKTTPKEALGNLQAALVNMYSATLDLLANANELLAKNTPARILNAIIHPTETKDLFSSLVETESKLSTEVQACESGRSAAADSRLLQELDNLNAPIIRIDQRVSTLLTKIESKEQDDILDWISKIQFGDHHNEIKESRAPNTCLWLINHPRFREWEDISSSVFLWPQGTGKLLHHI